MKKIIIIGALLFSNLAHSKCDAIYDFETKKLAQECLNMRGIQFKFEESESRGTTVMSHTLGGGKAVSLFYTQKKISPSGHQAHISMTAECNEKEDKMVILNLVYIGNEGWGFARGGPISPDE